jgi:uncharacterized membrane protein
MIRLKTISRILVGLLFVIAGILHFTKTGFFVSIVPSFLPFPAALVYIVLLRQVCVTAFRPPR